MVHRLKEWTTVSQDGLDSVSILNATITSNYQNNAFANICCLKLVFTGSQIVASQTTAIPSL